MHALPTYLDYYHLAYQLHSFKRQWGEVITCTVIHIHGLLALLMSAYTSPTPYFTLSLNWRVYTRICIYI